MYSFDYQRPDKSDAAVAFLKQHEDAKYLSGGQSLLPTMRLRLAQPSALVDVTRIGTMKDITVTGDKVTIGGAVCHAQVAADPEVRRALPGLGILPVILATGRFGSAGRSADRLPTMIRRRVIRRRYWR